MIKIKFILCILYLLFSLNVFSVQEDPFNSYIVQIPSKHGDSKINIAIKDNIDLAGFPTTAGSLALANNIPSKSAFLISKLEKANYHINGKTNLSEWANFRSEKSVSGWSSYGGQTTNPYGKELNPCGSSSGSAVAVASGLVKIAVGTETNGSISCPASVNGIVGLKPTVGLISRHGIIPISPTQDTAGPMGETVEVVAAALQAMSGRDVNDPATNNIPANFDFNFIKNLKENGVAGKRFGLLSSGRDNEDAAKLLDRIQKLITQLGGTVIEIEDSRQYPGSDEYFLLLYEFKVSLEKYLLQSSSSLKLSSP
jgi:Asp-tRNA(Asn)/Glu-tRNA(Gln) amidotransferase A subunit family amidase